MLLTSNGSGAVSSTVATHFQGWDSNLGPGLVCVVWWTGACLAIFGLGKGSGYL